MKKKLLIALGLLLLFTTYKPQQLFLGEKFNINEIIVENNFILKDINIKRDLTFLYDTNLIFLNTYDIKEKLKKIDFIDSFEIKKIYPKKLKIKIYEKKPIAILQYKRKKFYINKNIDLINYIYLEEFKDLPLVFSDKKNFKSLYINLKKINFPLDLIAKYYLYESKRWDLETYKKLLIKLPPENYTKSLKNFMKLVKNNSFEKYKIFDYRINNQLILK
jgi:cell division septal protein FtsQ